ncbi:Chloroperoxidase [Diplogelasinospora grovesii]|uniref:Chloroperoxidase n=1 Tax=Diplogelasinospora grovesii TaxID=303347 RepID=A0AAN6NB81_9PEZI|nr:Chloroperoxidase [Diplogelasinospora grovesii]
MASIGLAIFSAFSSVVAGALSVANALNPWGATSTKDHSWQKPSPTDRRSPCPMVNALANHGYLPRDGKSVSLAQLLTGCREGINLGADATLLVGVKALQTSSTGNPLTFHLDDLSKHGIIEHDGSLSRKDVAQGDNHTFDPEIWATVRAHFTEDKISIETAAAARKARLAAAPAANPEFHMSDADVNFSFIETCLYLRVFGEGINGNAPTQWVRTLFEHERLPFEEGFKRSDKPLTIADILALEKKVKAASA